MSAGSGAAVQPSVIERRMRDAPWRAEVSKQGLGYEIQLTNGWTRQLHFAWTATGAVRKARRLIDRMNAPAPRKWVIR